MSVGQEFDPSLLERKDRAELVAIATSLGEKPPARAKKADIVSLILRLVGAEDAAAAPGGADEGPAGDAPGDEAAGEAEAAGEDEAAGDDDEAGADGGADDGRARGERPEGSGQARGGAPGGRSGEQGGGRRQGGRGDAGDQQGRGDRSGEQDRGNRGDQGNQGGGQARGDQRNQGGGQARGDHGNDRDDQERGDHDRGDQPGGHGHDDGEPGNRRRRRRGRDRRGPEAEEPIGEPVDVEGVVDLRDEGYGFLRVAGYLPSRDDAYVSVKQVRQFDLRKGDVLKGRSRPANRNEKNPALLQIDEVNGRPAGEHATRRDFESLTPLFPDSRLRLELADDPGNMTARIIDLIAPIGKGQRGMVVSPPKAGKTTIVKQIVRSIEVNHPEVHLIVLLVDERPEEVTDMRRWLLRGEVAASTFDRPVEEHIAVSELVIERAKRLVEDGKDVVVVLDGITRLARAYNLAAPGTGRVMAGGIDTGALYPPKKFFGAARNVEEGGSLTILATALVETNTRMDEVIFEEFKGTGNMELKLDRGLANRRIFPAIDVEASSTRHEELLFDRRQLQQVWKLRRVLSGVGGDAGGQAAALEMLVDRLAAFRTNEDFLAEVAKAPDAG